MGPDDFFEETETTSPWSTEPTITTKLRKDFLNELRAGPVAGTNDLDAAISLTYLVWDDLIAFGTGGGNTLDGRELTLAQRALTATLARIGITLTFPWRDFTAFKAHRVRNGCLGWWQARRDLLNELLAPVQAELDRQEDAQFRAVNAEAESPHTKTGWPKVDEERRRFRTAATTRDYRDVGNRAVGVLEALSRTIYDPSVHLRDCETEPPTDKTKRLGRYVGDPWRARTTRAARRGLRLDRSSRSTSAILARRCRCSSEIGAMERSTITPRKSRGAARGAVRNR